MKFQDKLKKYRTSQDILGILTFLNFGNEILVVGQSAPPSPSLATLLTVTQQESNYEIQSQIKHVGLRRGYGALFHVDLFHTLRLRNKLTHKEGGEYGGYI